MAEQYIDVLIDFVHFNEWAQKRRLSYKNLSSFMPFETIQYQNLFSVVVYGRNLVCF